MKPTYSNDRKAPRMGKKEFALNIISKELWKEFRKSNPEYKDMKWEEFYEYWLDIAETVREETIENPLGVKLGGFTGELKLQYLPHKFEAEDKLATEEVGERVNMVNLVTNGKVGKIKWERRWAVKFNKMLQFYAFEPTRELNKMAKEYTDKNPTRIRVARNTLGGHSIWRKLKYYGK